MDTTTESLPSEPFWVGDWYVDPATNGLQKDEQMRRLEPRLMLLLRLFASQPGKVWSRQALRECLWPDTHVSRDAITRVISDLRKVLGDDPRNPRFITTIPKKGYLFVGEVKPVGSGRPTAERPMAEAETVAPVSPTVAEAPSRFPTAWVLTAVLLGLVVAVGIFVRSSRAADPPRFRPPSDTFLTNDPGVESQPAVSPDGSRIAFVKRVASWDQIFMVDANGLSEIQLTREPRHHRHPAWSPDGTTLAMYRTKGDEHDLATIPALGGQAVSLLSGREISDLDWSPTGDTLYFSEAHPTHGTFGLKSFHMTSRGTRTLTEPGPDVRGDFLPRVSPDGTSLAFARVHPSGHRDLHTLDLRGSQIATIPAHDLFAVGLDWQSDRHLVVSSFRHGTYGLWLIDIRDGRETWIPTRGERSYAPSISRDGHCLAYEKVNYEKNIWLVRPDQPEASHHSLINSGYWDCEAFFSPDGSRLAFTSSRSGALELWVCDAEGADPRQLTHWHREFITRPRWSPDGSRIAISALEKGQSKIYLVEPDSGAVTDTGERGLVCSWSPDGEALYFSAVSDGVHEIRRWSSNGGSAVPFVGDHAFYGEESVDGAWFFFTRRDRDGIWRRPLVGGREVRVVSGIPPRHLDNWGLSRDRLFFAATREGETVAASVNFAGEELREYGVLPRMASPSLSVSRDGKRLLYARVARFEVDLMLIRNPVSGF
ncbi:PD40 domain-containing protein [Sulfidibacter corallicola]|uniref:PD40 domain-containing protein n=1 Tax=Sulfidibacter corallicola TaxID=2818388 RepID=A0A8A4TND1_SULCO|nr:winged helix-turn-helix domain-containing protein [Sulfidibacter corallicola]QTD50612.1 PD40 domain-containing protein [Sulfidibacter corallicola]